MNKIRNFIKKIVQKIKQHKKLFIVCLIVVIALLVVLFMFLNKDDGMENQNDISIYYKTYTEEDGWSSFSKNGITSGDLVNDITNLEIKIKSNDIKGTITYSIYNSDKWQNGITIDESYGNQTFSGIKVATTGSIYKRFDICYRTYNEENGWLDWSCNAIINGNKDENIKAIEIKIIPKNVIKSEYLKDYKNYDVKSSIGF